MADDVGTGGDGKQSKVVQALKVIQSQKEYISKLEAEKKELSKKVHEQTSDLEESHKNYARLVDEGKRWNTVITERDEAIGKLHGEVAAKNGIINEQAGSIGKQKYELDQAKIKLGKAEQAYAGLEKQIEQERTSQEEIRKNFDAAQECVINLEGKLLESEEIIDGKNKEVTALSSEIKDYELREKQYRKDVQELQEKANTAEMQLAEMQSQKISIDELRQRMEQYVASADGLAQQLQGKNGELEAAKKELESQKSAHEELQRKLAGLEPLVAEYAAGVQRHSAEEAQYVVEKGAYETKIKELNKTLKEACDKLTSSESDKIFLHEQNSELKLNLEKLDAEKKELEEEIGRLESGDLEQTLEQIQEKLGKKPKAADSGIDKYLRMLDEPEN